MATDGTPAFDLAGSGVSELLPTDPRQIGGYRILGVLGSGGMGRVFLGLQPSSAGTTRLAAVKRVHPHLAADSRFRRYFGHELDNLARLPNGLSANLLDADRASAEPWFATEYVPGITLDQALEIHDTLPEPCLWLLLRSVAWTLAAVHELGIVHRDLKPSNIILTLDGLKVIDFGVARAADQSRATITGHVVGTPAFMAPEQATAAKNLTGAVDVFALGSLLTYAAQGEPPFGLGSAPDQLYRVVHAEPDLEAFAMRLPQLSQLIAACLAKAPEDRPSAAQLAVGADRYCPAQPLGAADSAWPREIANLILQRTVFAAKVARRSAEPATRIATPPQVHTRPVTAQPNARPESRAGYIAAAVLTSLAVAALVMWAVNSHSKSQNSTNTAGITSPTTAPYSDPNSDTDPATPTDSSSSPASDPATIVVDFYNAINDGDYATAWALGGDNLSPNFTTFSDGYSSTLTDSATATDTSATTADIQLDATQTDGTVKQYSGTYTVVDGVITAADVTQTN